MAMMSASMYVSLLLLLLAFENLTLGLECAPLFAEKLTDGKIAPDSLSFDEN